MKNQDVFVVGAVRTAIGSFGGSLKAIPLSHLATTAVKAALEGSGVDPESVGHVVMGNVIPTEPRDAYLSRVAAATCKDEARVQGERDCHGRQRFRYQ
jgi:acetyl-CoA C-acetyltransferase